MVAEADVASWITAVAATGAFVFTAIAVVLTWRSTRLQRFFELQSMMLEPRTRKGRHFINNMDPKVPVSQVATDKRTKGKFRVAERSLADFDMLALYVVKGYVSSALVEATFGMTLANLWPNAERIIEFRRTREGDSKQQWPFLVWFASHIGLCVSPSLALPYPRRGPFIRWRTARALVRAAREAAVATTSRPTQADETINGVGTPSENESVGLP